MDIVPIIYTVLLILIVVTLFILVYSFISLKQQQKRQTSLAIDNDVIINEVETKSVIEKKIITIPSKQKSIIKHKKIDEKIELRKINVPDKEQKSISKKEPPKTFKPTKRVKILTPDNMDLSSTTESNIKSKNIKEAEEKVVSLNNEILDKYINENQNDLFKLKVQEPKSKPKHKS